LSKTHWASKRVLNQRRLTVMRSGRIQKHVRAIKGFQMGWDFLMGWGFEWFLHEFQRGSEIRIGSNRLKLSRFSNGLRNYDFQVGWRIQSFESSQKIKGSNGLSVWTESELLRIAYTFGCGFWFFLINWVFFFDKSVFLF